MVSGFLERWSFVFTSEVDIARKFQKPVDPGISQQYDDYVAKLCALQFDGHPNLIELNSEANAIFLDWDEKNKAQILEHRNCKQGSLLSKGEGKMLRMALTLQLMTDTVNDQPTKEITAEAINGATKLSGYFLQNSLRILSLLDQPLEHDGLDDWKKRFLKDIPESFERKDAIALCETLNRKPRVVDEFLKNRKFFIQVSQGKYKVRQ